MIDSIEDLLLATLDAVSRFRVGQREAAGAALDAGALLTEAKGRLHHGEWGDWLGRVGIAPRTASTWMKLAGLDLTAEEVIDRGGINAAARGAKPKSASEAEETRSPGRYAFTYPTVGKGPRLVPACELRYLPREVSVRVSL